MKTAARVVREEGVSLTAEIEEYKASIAELQSTVNDLKVKLEGKASSGKYISFYHR